MLGSLTYFVVILKLLFYGAKQYLKNRQEFGKI